MAQTSPHIEHVSGSCSAFTFSWIFRAFSGFSASLSWVFQFRFALAIDILLSNFEAFFPSFTMSAAWAAIFAAITPSFISSAPGSPKCSEGVITHKKSAPAAAAIAPPMPPAI